MQTHEELRAACSTYQWAETPGSAPHIEQEHADNCEDYGDHEDGGEVLTCGLVPITQELEDEVADHARMAFREARAFHDNPDGEGTPFCVGCINGCGFCEP